MKETIFCDVDLDGSVKTNRKLFKESLLKFKGKRIMVTFESKNNRSVQQNRLWWLLMGIIAEELGYSKNEIHDICKYKFCKRTLVDEKTGETFEYLKSTSKLTKEEFGTLIDSLTEWVGTNFGIRLPQPF